MKYWDIKAEAEKTGALVLYGSISNAQVWGDEVTPKLIDEELKALGGIETLNVHINSGGGNVFAAQAIYSIVKRHPAQTKNAYIDGLAASAASLIPMACDKVYMPSNAMMMIHNPWAWTGGNASELRKTADILDGVREAMLNVYEEKTGQEKETLAKLLDDETWMTAEEALSMGFADEIEQERKIAASIDDDVLMFGEVKIKISDYKNSAKIAQMIETYRGSKKPEPVADKENKPKRDINEFDRIKKKILEV